MKKISIVFLTIFTMLFSMCVTCFAQEHNVTSPELSDTNNAYAVFYFYNNNDYWYRVVLYNSDDWTLTKLEDNYYKWTKNRETAYVRYSTYLRASSYNSDNSNGGWGILEQYDKMDEYGGSFRYELIDSNVDIYDSEGNLFFQGLSLMERVQLIMTEKFLPTVVGAMKILVLCGVGCLALLMVLKVFGKVFYRFQVR